VSWKVRVHTRLQAEGWLAAKDQLQQKRQQQGDYKYWQAKSTAALARRTALEVARCSFLLFFSYPFQIYPRAFKEERACSRSYKIFDQIKSLGRSCLLPPPSPHRCQTTAASKCPKPPLRCQSPAACVCFFNSLSIPNSDAKFRYRDFCCKAQEKSVVDSAESSIIAAEQSAQDDNDNDNDNDTNRQCEQSAANQLHCATMHRRSSLHHQR
jgi:hypothetical protein